ncbi:hypothetical protein ACFFGR_11405 [Arthrobacter liuii]|uniref:PknH-like extracellular domain-containing protein n=1 Tax=Arthrobacter liuii TaxID=1476996 RepID=A0ABQ2AB99_9MICC|nr:hypothetical protein [Arthrobacter liuii]GGH89455.1 hypothetical protein GCM10007170_00900 [Arthrobacter liuii]
MGTFGASALLAAALTACASPAAPQDNQPSAAAETSAATPTPTPTPTSEAKTYTADQLAAIVGKLRDSADRRLSVLGSADLARSMETAKAAITSLKVAPAECQELAGASNITAFDGAAMAAGQSIDSAAGSMSMVTLAAGLDESVLARIASEQQHVETCATMTMTASGVDYTVTLRPLEGAGSVPGTVAYRTDTTSSDGKKQSTIKAQAVQHGVLMTAVALGGESEADAVRRAGALLDAAAALIK